MEEIEEISIPWGNLFFGCLVFSVGITLMGTVLGGWSILRLGLDAVLLYLAYVPVIVLIFTLFFFSVVSIKVLLYSARWARYLLCLILFLLAAPPAAFMILIPQILLGGGLLVLEKMNYRVNGWEWLFVLTYYPVVFYFALIWSIKLYRILRYGRPFSSLWKKVHKYANDYTGAEASLRKLSAGLSKRSRRREAGLQLPPDDQ